MIELIEGGYALFLAGVSQLDWDTTRYLQNRWSPYCMAPNEFVSYDIGPGLRMIFQQVLKAFASVDNTFCDYTNGKDVIMVFILATEHERSDLILDLSNLGIDTAFYDSTLRFQAYVIKNKIEVTDSTSETGMSSINSSEEVASSKRSGRNCDSQSDGESEAIYVKKPRLGDSLCDTAIEKYSAVSDADAGLCMDNSATAVTERPTPSRPPLPLRPPPTSPTPSMFSTSSSHSQPTTTANACGSASASDIKGLRDAALRSMAILSQSPKPTSSVKTPSLSSTSGRSPQAAVIAPPPPPPPLLPPVPPTPPPMQAFSMQVSSPVHMFGFLPAPPPPPTPPPPPPPPPPAPPPTTTSFKPASLLAYAQSLAPSPASKPYNSPGPVTHDLHSASTTAQSQGAARARASPPLLPVSPAIATASAPRNEVTPPTPHHVVFRFSQEESRSLDITSLGAQEQAGGPRGVSSIPSTGADPLPLAVAIRWKNASPIASLTDPERRVATDINHTATATSTLSSSSSATALSAEPPSSTQKQLWLADRGRGVRGSGGRIPPATAASVSQSSAVLALEASKLQQKLEQLKADIERKRLSKTKRKTSGSRPCGPCGAQAGAAVVDGAVEVNEWERGSVEEELLSWMKEEAEPVAVTSGCEECANPFEERAAAEEEALKTRAKLVSVPNPDPDHGDDIDEDCVCRDCDGDVVMTIDEDCQTANRDIVTEAVAASVEGEIPVAAGRVEGRAVSVVSSVSREEEYRRLRQRENELKVHAKFIVQFAQLNN
jgi:hypothetical protein